MPIPEITTIMAGMVILLYRMSVLIFLNSLPSLIRREIRLNVHVIYDVFFCYVC